MLYGYNKVPADDTAPMTGALDEGESIHSRPGDSLIDPREEATGTVSDKHCS